MGYQNFLLSIFNNFDIIILAICISNPFVFSRQKPSLAEDDKDDAGKESDDLKYGYQNYYM